MLRNTLLDGKLLSVNFVVMRKEEEWEVCGMTMTLGKHCG
jgi:hypothetical protein